MVEIKQLYTRFWCVGNGIVIFSASEQFSRKYYTNSSDTYFYPYDLQLHNRSRFGSEVLFSGSWMLRTTHAARKRAAIDGGLKWRYWYICIEIVRWCHWKVVLKYRKVLKWRVLTRRNHYYNNSIQTSNRNNVSQIWDLSTYDRAVTRSRTSHHFVISFKYRIYFSTKTHI